jgi:hypothetical protein
VKEEDRQQNSWIWDYPTIFRKNWPNPIVPGPTPFGSWIWAYPTIYGNNWPNPIVPKPTPFG